MTARAVIWRPDTDQTAEVVADAVEAWQARGWVLLAERNTTEEE